MSLRLALVLVLVLTAGVPGIGLAKAVDPQPPHSAAAEVRCGERALPECTRERVKALQRLSATLRRAARQKPATEPRDPKAQDELARYDTWLARQSDRAETLAAEGVGALAAGRDAAPRQMSFNLQYLLLQTQMQNENRSYTAVSNIMKTKHDTVKNSISNIR